MSPRGELFGTALLDKVLAASCHHTSSQDVVTDIMAAVDRYTQASTPTDDRTLVIALVDE